MLHRVQVEQWHIQMELAHREPDKYRHTGDEHRHGEQRAVRQLREAHHQRGQAHEREHDRQHVDRMLLRGSTSNMNFAPMRIEMMPTANGTTYIDVRLT